jgi:hypothetical protein
MRKSQRGVMSFIAMRLVTPKKQNEKKNPKLKRKEKRNP